MSGTKQHDKKWPEPELEFTPLAWNKMWAITHACKIKNSWYECSFSGRSAKGNPNLIEDMYVLEQVNEHTHTEIDEVAGGRWVVEMVAKGHSPGQCNFFGHSHGSMEVFLSPEDLDTVNRMDGGSGVENIQWSVVTNVAGNIYVQADIFVPLRWTWKDCSYSVRYPDSPGLDEWVRESKKVMTFKPPVAKHVKAAHGGWGRHHRQRQPMWGGGVFHASAFEHSVPSEPRWGKEKPEVELPAVEYEEFTNRVVQNAHDLGIIDTSEATLLEHQTVVNPDFTDSDLLDELIDELSEYEEKYGVELELGADSNNPIKVKIAENPA